MNSIFSEHTVHVNKIDLHYIEYKNDQPKILLMHGLTANAHVFDGLVNAGLGEAFHIISIDFRGRGLSSKPAFAYSIKEHANDMIALMDELKIDRIILCGHSFGGLLATYLAYHHSHRFTKIIILDAAPQMNSKSAEMLGPAIARIDKRYENFETYLSEIKAAPYLTFWDERMLSYYQADVATAEDLTVEPHSNISSIVQSAVAVSKENWNEYFEKISQPVLLVNATGDYILDMPLLPEGKAREIVSRMKNCRYTVIKGNHQTMLYGEHAKVLVKLIVDFAE